MKHITSENSKKYHFKDFTLDHYKEILTEVKKNHIICNYSNIPKINNFALIRHDVDFSVIKTFEIAKIESKMGIQASYFVLLTSEHYNLLEKENLEIIREILQLGHKIGLHFDASYYNIKNEDEIEKYLNFEKNIVEALIDQRIDVFSFHNTTDFTMQCKKWEYNGLINTYAEIFQSEIKYCSDSNGYWRFDRMIDFIKENKSNSIQLLTHPVWWQKEIMSPQDKIWNCIDSNAERLKSNYLKYLKKFGRQSIV